MAVRAAAPLRLLAEGPDRRATDRDECRRVVPHLSDTRDRPPGPDTAPVAGRVPGLIHHQPHEQRRRRGDQRDHRAPPPHLPRLPQPQQLPTTHAPRRWRDRPVTPTEFPKSPIAQRLGTQTVGLSEFPDRFRSRNHLLTHLVRELLAECSHPAVLTFRSALSLRGPTIRNPKAAHTEAASHVALVREVVVRSSRHPSYRRNDGSRCCVR